MDFAFSAGTGGMVRWILMEEMMCQVLLSSPLVLLGHTHVVLVLFLLNTFSHSWTSQKLCNFLFFACILKPLSKKKEKENEAVTFRVKLLPEHVVVGSRTWGVSEKVIPGAIQMAFLPYVSQARRRVLHN